ncbi:MAG: transglycosylase domain-containing protein [Actinomycetota bacterium]
MKWSSSPKSVVVLAAFGLLAASCSEWVEDLPELTKKDLKFSPPESSKLFAGDGTLIKTFHGEQNRTVVDLEDIPKQVQNAVLAIEDQRFYEHEGVDLKAIIRAALANVGSGRIEEGGSTITQQYVKQMIIAPGEIAEKSYERKIQEAALSRQIETELTKKEILERYLNTIYLGQGAYGFQAAAKAYFEVPAKELSIDQGALLAGVIQQPGTFDPFKHPKAAKRRREVVLNRMAALDFIGERRARRLSKKPLGVVKVDENEKNRYQAAYFVDYVQKMLIYHPRFEMLGNTPAQRNKALFQGGLRIRTTVDLGMQRAAEEAVSSILYDAGDPHASLVAIQPSNGHVKAMVGGRDYFAKKKEVNGRFAKLNLAILGEPGLGPKKSGRTSAGEGRQSGSAFKAFTLTAAVEQGIPLTKTYKGGSCRVFPEIAAWASDEGLCNYEGSAYGQVSLLEATIKSINIVYVGVGLDIGTSATTEAAEKMGVRTELLGVPSAPLGTNPVNALGMTSGYSTLASNGVYHPPLGVTRIYDSRKEKILYRAPRTQGRSAIEPSTASIVTNALQQVITKGTGTAAAIGRPAAGKTGTGQEYRDAWFAGYTPDLAAAVWVGYPQAEIPMTTTRIGSVTGGSWPAQIWQSFMSSALANTPARDFTSPAGLTFATIDTRTGCLAGESTPSEFESSTPFTPGTAPTATCAHRLPQPKVPEVFGFPVARATNLLEEAGFTVTVEREFDRTYAPGRVIAQKPNGGVRAMEGSTVTLTVSTRTRR